MGARADGAHCRGLQRNVRVRSHSDFGVRGDIRRSQPRRAGTAHGSPAHPSWMERSIRHRRHRHRPNGQWHDRLLFGHPRPYPIADVIGRVCVYRPNRPPPRGARPHQCVWPGTSASRGTANYGVLRGGFMPVTSSQPRALVRLRRGTQGGAEGLRDQPGERARLTFAGPPMPHEIPWHLRIVGSQAFCPATVNGGAVLAGAALILLTPAQGGTDESGPEGSDAHLQGHDRQRRGRASLEAPGLRRSQAAL